ncbi:MAG: DUF4406 domain-containing protein [Porphyromonas sp.]|nr:DUF4406 domain-containing protein [Porphyromonas sp.]
MKRIIYISGPISKLPYKEAWEAFSCVEEKLRRVYPTAKVVNPMKKLVPKTLKWQWHMILDLIQLSSCSHIYLMKGWQQSNGARIEYRWAKQLGIKVLTRIP